MRRQTSFSKKKLEKENKELRKQLVQLQSSLAALATSDKTAEAGGILGYVTTLLEQIVLIHLIKIILKTKPALLNEIFFIKDGPLAFFGQTANMYKPMRNLTKYLIKNHNLYLAGLEKSGTFVEHADEISKKN